MAWYVFWVLFAIELSTYAPQKKTNGMIFLSSLVLTSGNVGTKLFKNKIKMGINMGIVG